MGRPPSQIQNEVLVHPSAIAKGVGGDRPMLGETESDVVGDVSMPDMRIVRVAFARDLPEVCEQSRLAAHRHFVPVVHRRNDARFDDGRKERATTMVYAGGHTSRKASGCNAAIAADNA